MEIGPLVQEMVVTVGPGHTLLDAAIRMCDHNVGSAVVLTDEGYPGILTERDLLRAMSRGADLSTATVGDFMTSTPVTASSHWDVVEAARTMIEGGFRHLIVLDDGRRPAGVLSIRDLVAALLEDRQRLLAATRDA